ncbi:hypothetical protein QD357_05820 [Rhizobium sp. BR 317]|uniref:hypothetical protein n=1 Tax=Rhizobium sp. BR 317 TaxID=3040015 RepID=UPI0039BEF97D
MGRRQATYSAADIARAVKGARDGGIVVGRVEIEQGKIIVFAQSTKPDPQSALDQWIEKDAR